MAALPGTLCKRVDLLACSGLVALKFARLDEDAQRGGEGEYRENFQAEFELGPQVQTAQMEIAEVRQHVCRDAADDELYRRRNHVMSPTPFPPPAQAISRPVIAEKCGGPGEQSLNEFRVIVGEFDHVFPFCVLLGWRNPGLNFHRDRSDDDLTCSGRRRDCRTHAEPCRRWLCCRDCRAAFPRRPALARWGRSSR